MASTLRTLCPITMPDMLCACCQHMLVAHGLVYPPAARSGTWSCAGALHLWLRMFWMCLCVLARGSEHFVSEVVMVLCSLFMWQWLSANLQADDIVVVKVRRWQRFFAMMARIHSA
eukprot:8741357-Alexandrium_andersonii.AAC.1